MLRGEVKRKKKGKRKRKEREREITHKGKENGNGQEKIKKLREKRGNIQGKKKSKEGEERWWQGGATNFLRVAIRFPRT